MAHELIYRFRAMNEEGQQVIIHISDTDSPEGTPDFIDLTLRSCRMIVESPGGNKHAVIKSTRLEWVFEVTELIGLPTFTQGHNNRFYVEAFFLSAATTPIFSGYLINDATKEKFVQYRGTDGQEMGVYGVELVATDQLAILREIPLTDDTGTNPRGYFKPIQYIAWCLQKTGLSLPVTMIDGIVEENVTDPSVDGNWVNHTYVWSKSFEKEIDVSIDCYTALEMLLKGRVLFQWMNSWWIVRTDEINGSTSLGYRYDAEGIFDTIVPGINAVKEIGPDEDIILVGSGGEVFPERPYKFVQLERRYEYPREIIDNIDFSRFGADAGQTVDMSLYVKAYANLGAFPSNGSFEWTYKANDTGNFYRWNGTGYTLLTGAEEPVGNSWHHLDWTLVKLPSGTPAIQSYIAEIMEGGVPRDRYLVIPGANEDDNVVSNRIPVHAGDRIVFSFDKRNSVDIGGSGWVTDPVCQMRLYGEDGSQWAITNQAATGEVPGQWIPFFNRFIMDVYKPAEVDEREWRTISVDSRPIPISGELEIRFRIGVFGASCDTHFTNLQFEYIPLIRGTYTKYSGQYHKVSTDENYSANLIDEIGVTDLPKRLFKWALHKLVGGKYILAERFYNWNATTSGELGIAAFGKYQAFDYWNQHFKEFRVVQDSLLGINSLTAPTNPPGLWHTYRFNYNDYHTNDKEWMLLSYNMDLMSGRWEGVFAEVFDHSAPKFWTWPHEFKLLYEA